MRRGDATMYEGRIHEMAHDIVQVLRTSLHFGTWSAHSAVFARPYMERNRPFAEDELYETAHMGHIDVVRIPTGRAADKIYFRAPLRTAEDRARRRPRRRNINPNQNWQPINLTHEEIETRKTPGRSRTTQRMNDK